MENSRPSADHLLAGMEQLYDRIIDTVFFVKDQAGRYTKINETLVRRLGKRTKDEVTGRLPTELFPPILGERIARQDRSVIDSGVPIAAILELHFYPNGDEGWCFTWKEPLRNAEGKVTGLIGLSRDLNTPQSGSIDLKPLSGVITYINAHVDRPLRLPQIAKLGRMSVWQLDQRIRNLFGMTAGQYIIHRRIETACIALRSGNAPIAEVALSCGYADQAAFTRQFSKSVGLTPRAFREATRTQRQA